MYNYVQQSFRLHRSKFVIEIFDKEIAWSVVGRNIKFSRKLSLSRLHFPPFIFEIAMPSDIPYNFRQSSSRGDTITSPMIYDQSLPKEGRGTIYEQWLWHGKHKTTGAARWKPLHGNYAGRSPDHLEGVKAQMKSAGSPERGKKCLAVKGEREFCITPRRERRRMMDRFTPE